MPSHKQLDRRCTILVPTVTSDAAGGPITTYTEGRRVWCRREDHGGSERRTSDALRSQADAKFQLRWFPGLTPECRIVCEGRTYDIDGLSEWGRRQWWEIEATEHPGQTQ